MRTILVTAIFADGDSLPARWQTILVGGIVVGLLSTFCLFLPSRVLTRPEVANWIGTTDPLVARGACLLGAVVGWGMVAVVVRGLTSSI